MSFFSSKKRLDNAYKNAFQITFNNQSKFILFSDCHRGDNSFADDFANNRNIYQHALNHYFENGFTYIELGDGDELWENLFFKDIFEANKNTFMLHQKMFFENKIHFIYGNHDMVYKNEHFTKKTLTEYFDPKTGQNQPLFPNIKYHEAIVLIHEKTKQELFLAHGHQADFMNYVGWKINRFLVRVLWKPLQIWGIKDPTSPAKNYTELKKVEHRIKNWIQQNKNIITIVGHTHRPRFPKPSNQTINYFNNGSCVHPRSITGIEIFEGKIALIKWFIGTTNNGTLQIFKEYLEKPENIADYSNT